MEDEGLAAVSMIVRLDCIFRRHALLNRSTSGTQDLLPEISAQRSEVPCVSVNSARGNTVA